MIGTSQFQSTRPYGARRKVTRILASSAGFQPTRPYRARLVIAHVDHLVRHVSTHAPLWGATTSPFSPSSKPVVSFHAPLWGATPLDRLLPRLHVVSIHAPLWGATGSLCRIVHFSLIVFIFQDAQRLV